MIHGISVSEAARLLGVTRGRIYQLISEGHLRYKKSDVTVIIDPDSIEECRRRPDGRGAHNRKTTTV